MGTRAQVVVACACRSLGHHADHDPFQAVAQAWLCWRAPCYDRAPQVLLDRPNHSPGMGHGHQPPPGRKGEGASQTGATSKPRQDSIAVIVIGAVVLNGSPLRVDHPQKLPERGGRCDLAVSTWTVD